jgi:hypothetical protein
MPNNNPEDQDSWTLEDQKQLARLRERRKNSYQNTPLRDVLQMMYWERQSEDYHIDNGLERKGWQPERVALCDACDPEDVEENIDDVIIDILYNGIEGGEPVMPLDNEDSRMDSRIIDRRRVEKWIAVQIYQDDFDLSDVLYCAYEASCSDRGFGRFASCFRITALPYQKDERLKKCVEAFDESMTADQLPEGKEQ